MPGQSIDVGRREAFAIGVAVFAVAVLLLSLPGGDGNGDQVVEPNESASVQVEDISQGVRVSAEGYIENVEFVGAYRGRGFREVYPSQDDPKMRISRDLRPGDGVVDVWIAPRFVNVSTDPAFVATIYLDEDFRDEVGPVNITWGPNWTDRFRRFEYEETQPGIYTDRIVDTNMSRFERMGPNSDGETNVAVGNFSRGMVGLNASVRHFGLTLVTAR